MLIYLFPFTVASSSILSKTSMNTTLVETMTKEATAMRLGGSTGMIGLYILLSTETNFSSVFSILLLGILFCFCSFFFPFSFSSMIVSLFFLNFNANKRVKIVNAVQFSFTYITSGGTSCFGRGCGDSIGCVCSYCFFRAKVGPYLRCLAFGRYLVTAYIIVYTSVPFRCFWFLV